MYKYTNRLIKRQRKSQIHDLLQAHLVHPGLYKIHNTYLYKETAPRIKCKDGYEFSVQAGSLLYSEPKENHGPYEAVEVGIFNYIHGDVPEAWLDYIEHGGEVTIFPYIPIDLVVDFIWSHGGMDV